MQFLSVRPLADAAITLDFATTIGVAVSARVHSALLCLRRGVAAGLLPGGPVWVAICGGQGGRVRAPDGTERTIPEWTGWAPSVPTRVRQLSV